MNYTKQISYARAALGILHGTRAFGGPVDAQLLVTNRCNIHCLHCSFYSPRLDRPNMRPVKLARLKGNPLPDRANLKRLQALDADWDWLCELTQNLLSMGTRRFEISGSGEPFLYPNLLELAGRLKSSGSSCLMYTNGTLLSPPAIDKLIGIGFDELRITTMAGSRGVYSSTHPGVPAATFDKIRDNLAYLSERKKALGSKKPEVTLIFVMISQNVEDLFQFAQFAAATKVDRAWYRPFVWGGDPNLAPLSISKVQHDSAIEQLGEAKAYLESRNIQHNLDEFPGGLPIRFDTSQLYRMIPCYYGWLGAVIHPDGTVYPCCGCNQPLGNACESDFDEIWQSAAYRRFRKQARKINTRGTSVDDCLCNECSHYAANIRVHHVFHPFKRVALPSRCDVGV